MQRLPSLAALPLNQVPGVGGDVPGSASIGANVTGDALCTNPFEELTYHPQNIKIGTQKETLLVLSIRSSPWAPPRPLVPFQVVDLKRNNQAAGIHSFQKCKFPVRDKNEQITVLFINPAMPYTDNYRNYVLTFKENLANKQASTHKDLPSIQYALHKNDTKDRRHQPDIAGREWMALLNKWAKPESTECGSVHRYDRDVSTNVSRSRHAVRNVHVFFNPSCAPRDSRDAHTTRR